MKGFCSPRVLIPVNTIYFFLIIVDLSYVAVCRLLFMLVLLFEISPFCSISKWPLCCRIGFGKKNLISVAELN